MRITESQLRRIIAEEAKSLRQGRRINEGIDQAEAALEGGLETYVDEMTRSGVEIERVCMQIQNFVNDWCEELRQNISSEY